MHERSIHGQYTIVNCVRFGTMWKHDNWRIKYYLMMNTLLLYTCFAFDRKTHVVIVLIYFMKSWKLHYSMQLSMHYHNYVEYNAYMTVILCMQISLHSFPVIISTSDEFLIIKSIRTNIEHKCHQCWSTGVNIKCHQHLFF